MLTKRQKGILLSANRKCGVSYRSVCNRGLQETALALKNEGFLYLHDTGRKLGQFIYRTTAHGKEQLK